MTTTWSRRPTRHRPTLVGWVDGWSAADRSGTGARRAASAGLQLLAVVGAAIAVTLPLLSPRPLAWVVLAGYVLTAALLAAATRSPRWDRTPERLALVFPAVVFVATGAVATVSPGAGVAYAAFFTLGFAWTGLFAPVSSGRVLLLLAWPAYAQTLPADVEFTLPAAVRLFFLTALWLALSEVLGTLTSRERSRQLDLRRASETDPLTGLGNRRAIAPALAAVHPGDSVALLDLDHFKQLNDTLGHAAGDEVLAALGDHLRHHLRAGDLVARWGGEEFLVLLPGTPVLEAVQVVDRLRSSWAAEQRTTLSAGVAEHPHVMGAPPAPHEVVVAADGALYEAKRAGRNQVRAAAPGRSSAAPVGACGNVDSSLLPVRSPDNFL